MSKKQIHVSVMLPNGKGRQFTLAAGKGWRANLKAELVQLYPKSSDVRFVEDLKEATLLSSRPYRSNIMFEIRKNFFEAGHVTASIPGDGQS